MPAIGKHLLRCFSLTISVKFFKFHVNLSTQNFFVQDGEIFITEYAERESQVNSLKF